MAGTNRLRSILGRFSRSSSDTETATEDGSGTTDDAGGGTTTPSTRGLVVPPADELETPVSPEVIRSTADPSFLAEGDPSAVEVLNRVQEFFEKEIEEDGPFLGAWLSAIMDHRTLAEVITIGDDEVFVMVEGERLGELGQAIDVSPGAMRVVRDVHAGYAEVNGLVEYTLSMSVLCIEVPEGQSLTEDEVAVPGLTEGAT